MKRTFQLKGFFTGFLTATVLMTAVGGVFAAGGLTGLEADFGAVRRMVVRNVEKVAPEDMKPFVYNGRTYVSAKFIGEALGEKVVWDEDSGTVYIGGDPRAMVQSVNASYVGRAGDLDLPRRDYTYIFNALCYSQKQQQMSFGTAPDWSIRNTEGKTLVEVVRQEALEELLKMTIQLHEAGQAGMTLTEDEIRAADRSLDNLIAQQGQEEAEKRCQAIYQLPVEDVRVMNHQVALMMKFAAETEKKNAPGEAAQRQAYDAARDQYDQVTVRHVLLMTRDASGNPLSDTQKAEKKAKAQDILNQLNQGADMAVLAKQYSEDPGSSSNAGEYTFGRGQMVREFEDWAFAAKDGSTGLVETQYGYHVMQMVRRTGFGDVRAEIIQNLSQKAYQDLLSGWMKESRYTLQTNQVLIDTYQAK